MQAILDRLTGASPATRLPASAFSEPWRTIYARVRHVPNRAAAERLIAHATRDLLLHHGATVTLLNRLPPDDAFASFPPFEQLSRGLPPVDWLWPSWIPRGMLTLFGAAPGVGKSLVALDLARRIIHGQPFPDGAPVPCPGANVLLVDAEGAPTLLKQRVQAWQIDGDRLFLMRPPEPARLIDLSDPLQQLLLIEMVAALRPPFVIVDSLAAATSHGETSLKGARKVLGFLSDLAARAQLALLIIHHLRKRARSSQVAPSPRVAADDLRGSSHISAAARSVLALSLVPASPAPPPSLEAALAGPLSISATSSPTRLDGPRRLEVVKTNLCRPPSPLRLTFEGDDLPVPTLRYSAWVEPAPPPTHLDLCARWLLQYLADAAAPVKPAAAIQAAAGEGFSRRTLYRARRALAGLIIDLGDHPNDPRKRWTLAPAPPADNCPDPPPRAAPGNDTPP
jgi:hypothetical protein